MPPLPAEYLRVSQRKIQDALGEWMGSAVTDSRVAGLVFGNVRIDDPIVAEPLRRADYGAGGGRPVRQGHCSIAGRGTRTRRQGVCCWDSCRRRQRRILERPLVVMTQRKDCGTGRNAVIAAGWGGDCHARKKGHVVAADVHSPRTTFARSGSSTNRLCSV